MFLPNQCLCFQISVVIKLDNLCNINFNPMNTGISSLSRAVLSILLNILYQGLADSLHSRTRSAWIVTVPFEPGLYFDHIHAFFFT